MFSSLQFLSLPLPYIYLFDFYGRVSTNTVIACGCGLSSDFYIQILLRNCLEMKQI